MCSVSKERSAGRVALYQEKLSAVWMCECERKNWHLFINSCVIKCSFL